MKILVLMLAFISFSAFALEYNHTISGSSTSQMLVDRQANDTDTSLVINTRYGYYFGMNTQAEVSLVSQFFFGDTYKTNLYNVSFGPVFNIFCTKENKLQNAFYITPKFGIVRYEVKYSSYTSDYNDAYVSLEVGKRFALNKRVSLDISVSTAKILDSEDSDNEKLDFVIQPFGFTFYL